MTRKDIFTALIVMTLYHVQRHERKCNKSNLTDTFGATSNSHDLFHEISSSSDNEG